MRHPSTEPGPVEIPFPQEEALKRLVHLLARQAAREAHRLQGHDDPGGAPYHEE
jgi:hypothetical protein